MERDILDGIRAVIFDLDGTLIDSTWMWPDIDRDFLAGRGFEVPSDLSGSLEGLSMWEDAVYFKERFGLEDSEEELVEIWNGMALFHYENDTPLKPGAREFLEHLKSRGIKRGVFTSNTAVLFEAAARANKILDEFDAVVTSEDISRGKPDPEGYLLAAERLSVEPQHCLVIEDLPAGLLGAQNAGMRAAAMHDDYSDRYLDEKLSLSKAFIRDYRELLP